jgi:hypothetical protein
MNRSVRLICWLALVAPWPLRLMRTKYPRCAAGNGLPLRSTLPTGIAALSTTVDWPQPTHGFGGGTHPSWAG